MDIAHTKKLQNSKSKRRNIETYVESKNGNIEKYLDIKQSGYVRKNM